MNPYESSRGRNESEQETLDNLRASERCSHCREKFYGLDDLTKIDGEKLCGECLTTYREEHAAELLNATV